MEELLMGERNRFYVDITAMHNEVTGSCILAITKLPNEQTIRFVVDCGLFQEREYEELNSELLFKPEDIDFCIITHNHVDHVGRVPFLVKEGFNKEIYTTVETSKLLPLSLGDSYRVLKDTYKRKNERCLYDEEDVEKTLSLVKPCEYEKIIHIGKHIKITFFNNGHLIGAASVLAQISYPGSGSINMLFTGDYNNKNMFFDVKKIPKWVVKLPLTVIQESTYGDMDSTCITKTFKKNVKECIEKEGTVIVLVFSLGRAQEILYEIKTMQDEGELEDIPIYFDGKLAIRYTNLYINGGLNIKEEMKDFLPKNLEFVDKSTRMTVLNDTSKKIILTTSGMGSYGPAQLYIPEYITRPNALIQFTGYTAEGTLGSRLKNADMGDMVEISGILVEKKARVEYTTEYSANAKADEMIEFLKQFEDLKLVLVNHGETDTKKKFAKRILKEVNPKRVGLLEREYFFRINSWGLIKSLPTKFK